MSSHKKTDMNLKVSLDKDGNLRNTANNTILDGSLLLELINNKTGATATWLPQQKGGRAYLLDVTQGKHGYQIVNTDLYMKGASSVAEWAAAINALLADIRVWCDTRPEDEDTVEFI